MIICTFITQTNDQEQKWEKISQPGYRPMKQQGVADGLEVGQMVIRGGSDVLEFVQMV